MQISTRNRIKGTVASVEKGPIFAKVKLTLADGTTLTSAILSESAEELGLKSGDAVYAMVKATDVSLAKA